MQRRTRRAALRLQRCFTFALFLLLAFASAGRAQRPRFGRGPLVWASGWAGRLSGQGGFSNGPVDFFSLRNAFAYGGSLHFVPGAGVALGVDAVLSRPDYTRFDRTQRIELSSGQAKLLAFLGSLRLQGSPGPIGVFLTGGVGVARWDIPELGGTNTDPALQIGAGLEYRYGRHIALFAQYDQWWIYHDKTEGVAKNKVSPTLLRFGARLGI